MTTTTENVTGFDWLVHKLGVKGGAYDGHATFTAPLHSKPFKLSYVGTEKMLASAVFMDEGTEYASTYTKLLMSAYKDGRVTIYIPAEGTYETETELKYRPMVNRMLRVARIPFRVRFSQDEGEWMVEGLDSGAHQCGGIKSKFCEAVCIGDPQFVNVEPIYS